MWVPACPSGTKMRTSSVAVIVAIALELNGSAIQKPEDGGIPPSGKTDTLVVRGCVTGSLLKDLRAQKTEPLTGSETAVVYRLTGEKKLLQVIQKEHQDQVLDVTGVLASNPNSTSTVRSKDMGKARVFVGAGRQETSEPGKPPSYPTLKVTSFEVVRPGCQP
jgi:hypothetical protein